jgi:hypothetical protein
MYYIHVYYVARVIRTQILEIFSTEGMLRFQAEATQDEAAQLES